jgi:hypothetical protein
VVIASSISIRYRSGQESPQRTHQRERRDAPRSARSTAASSRAATMMSAQETTPAKYGDGTSSTGDTGWRSLCRPAWCAHGHATHREHPGERSSFRVALTEAAWNGGGKALPAGERVMPRSVPVLVTSPSTKAWWCPGRTRRPPAVRCPRTVYPGITVRVHERRELRAEVAEGGAGSRSGWPPQQRRASNAPGMNDSPEESKCGAPAMPHHTWIDAYTARGNGAKRLDGMGQAFSGARGPRLTLPGDRYPPRG